MKILRVIGILITSSILFTACSKSTVKKQEKNIILASIYPVWFMTAQVVSGIEDISVELMIQGGGGCPHNLSLSPQEMQKLYDSEVIISHGLGIDEFLDHAIENGKGEIGDVPVIVLSDGISDSLLHLVSKQSLFYDKHIGHDHGHAGEFKGVNPHCWVSPRRAADEVRHLTVELAKLFPHHSEKLLRNGNRTASRLDSLADKFTTFTSTLANPKIVTVHDAFAWFAIDTHLEIVSTLETEGGSEPSPRELNQIIKKIVTEKPLGIFIQAEPAPDLATMISKRTGVPIFVLDPVSYGTTDMDYYFEVMDKNYSALQTAAKLATQ